MNRIQSIQNQSKYQTKKKVIREKGTTILVQLNPSPNERTHVVLQMHQQIMNESLQMV